MIKGEYPRWARGHHMRSPVIQAAKWATQRKHSPPPPPRACACGCGRETPSQVAVYARQCKPLPAWRGGLCRVDGGYISRSLPTHPNANSGGRVLEHRYVMETSLKRLLTSDESVHHINGVRDDNRLENLQLRRKNHGQGQALRCLDCGSHNVQGVAL